MKDQLLNLLLNLYFDREGYDIVYDRVDEFYSYLGYTLEAEDLLQDLEVQSTSDLVELLEKAEESQY